MATDHPIEEWRTVEGWPAYEVSNLGRVRRARTSYKFNPLIGSITVARYAGTFLVPSTPKKKRAYRKVTLCNGPGQKGTFTVPSLVCAAFHGPRPSPKHEVAHGDGNHVNDVASNLRWATPTENNEDRRRHGTLPLGERHHAAILSEEQVKEILSRFRGGEPGISIAKDYPVKLKTLYRIKQGRAWRHLERSTMT